MDITDIKVVSTRKRTIDEQSIGANPFAGVAKINGKYGIIFTAPMEDAVDHLYQFEPEIKSLISKGKYTEVIEKVEL